MNTRTVDLPKVTRLQTLKYEAVATFTFKETLLTISYQVTRVNSGYLALEQEDDTAVITHVFSFLCDCVNLNTEEFKSHFYCIYMNDLSGDISFVLKHIEFN